VTVRATGAQRLARHCMSYDAARQQFSYRWKLGTQHTGKVTLEIQLTYTSVSRLWEQVTVAGSHPGRR
jgi:hypothetical protein